MAMKLSKQQTQMLAAIVICGGAAIFCYVRFFWMPFSKKKAELNAQIEKLSKDIEQAQRQAARLPELEKQMVSLNEEKIEAEKRLPKEKSVPDILVTIGALGANYRVALMSFSPGGSGKPQQYFIELHFPVSMKGTFHNLGKFFASLALQQRLFNVFNVSFPEPDATTGDMSVNFELVSYQYKE